MSEYVTTWADLRLTEPELREWQVMTKVTGGAETLHVVRASSSPEARRIARQLHREEFGFGNHTMVLAKSEPENGEGPHFFSLI